MNRENNRQLHLLWDTMVHCLPLAVSTSQTPNITQKLVLRAAKPKKSKINLCGLPSELLYCIFSHCSPSDLCSLARTCGILNAHVLVPLYRAVELYGNACLRKFGQNFEQRKLLLNQTRNLHAGIFQTLDDPNGPMLGILNKLESLEDLMIEIHYHGQWVKSPQDCPCNSILCLPSELPKTLSSCKNIIPLLISPTDITRYNQICKQRPMEYKHN